MRRYIVFIAIVLVMTSCKKWLDVKPQSQVTKDDLFTTEAGFQESLNGVYSRCTQADLYGKELSFCLPEVLAQNYTMPTLDVMQYLQTSLYNYGDPRFIGRKDSIWRGIYHAIANCNLILENADQKRTILSAENYGLIKGEALALRAYLHFDVLRLFAPAFSNNPAAKLIPYVTVFSNKVTPAYTVAAVGDSILRDLNEAKSIMRPVDPILRSSYVVGYNTDLNAPELASNTLFLQNRRHRMNYYAICATLARVSLYLDKKQEALANAREVIDAKKFPWTNPADFIHADPTKKDRIMYKELVFGWYLPQRKERTDSLFATGRAGFFMDRNGAEALYETGGVGGADNRYKQWMQFVGGSGSPDRYDLVKYLRDALNNRHYLMAPAIRLSELYYIAAEAMYDTNPTGAFSLVDSVRFHRGIGTAFTAPNKEVFLQELVKEARKEFYGEGQIFYMYKRLNRNMPTPSGSSIPASNKVFVLPLPNDEIEFGNR